MPLKWLKQNKHLSPFYCKGSVFAAITEQQNEQVCTLVPRVKDGSVYGYVLSFVPIQSKYTLDEKAYLVC